jgi:hypothetical protein
MGSDNLTGRWQYEECSGCTVARHSSLQMAQRYVEVSEGAMKRVVG